LTFEHKVFADVEFILHLYPLFTLVHVSSDVALVEFQVFVFLVELAVLVVDGNAFLGKLFGLMQEFFFGHGVEAVGVVMEVEHLAVLRLARQVEVQTHAHRTRTALLYQVEGLVALRQPRDAVAGAVARS